MSSTSDATATLEGHTCPEGQILTMKYEIQDGSRVNQGISEVLIDCPLQSRRC
ncbi:MAG: hypothetical protein PHO08_20185 [Methylococcales bacterium]|nr:hypothetical protein [Methylococcales bacterium]